MSMVFVAAKEVDRVLNAAHLLLQLLFSYVLLLKSGKNRPGKDHNRAIP